MKKLETIIPAKDFLGIYNALIENGIQGLTVTDEQGYYGATLKDTFKDAKYNIKIELVCHNDLVNTAIYFIKKNSSFKRKKDIFLYDVQLPVYMNERNEFFQNHT